LKYSEYSVSDDMGQSIDLPTSKLKEYKISDSAIDLPSLKYNENKITGAKGMGDIKMPILKFTKFMKQKGMGDIKYFDQEIDNLIIGDLLMIRAQV
jgi:hypothetical protein